MGSALKEKPFSFRYESFGGIIQLEHPQALLYVDREFMRRLGYAESPLWTDRVSGESLLSAPTEVQLSLTNRCGAGCRHCHADSRPADGPGRELGRDGMIAVLGELARMRVFHVTLGGGESTELPWLFEIAHLARGMGVNPSLTTNGFFVTEDNVVEFNIFDRVNVSLDGVGDRYATHRGVSGYDRAVAALRLLRDEDIPVGIHCVISRDNFDHMDEVFHLGREIGVQQLELLRYKPAGRAGRDLLDYLRHDLTDEQAWDFFPRVMRLAQENKTPLALDCSFTPYLYAHGPDPKLMERYGVTGCLGGNTLCGVTADGLVSACPFSASEGRSIDDMHDWWGSEETFFSYRHWMDAAPEPCRSCDYLAVCRGGCHAVSKFVFGDVYSPDPGCPLVRRHFAHTGLHRAVAAD